LSVTWHAQVSLAVLWRLGVVGSGDVAYAGVVGTDRQMTPTWVVAAMWQQPWVVMLLW